MIDSRGDRIATLSSRALVANYVAALADAFDVDLPLYRTEDARVAGRFLNARVTSVFQPIVDLPKQATVGHQGLLRIDTTGDSPLAPWSLFALAAGDATLRHLDRLCRTLHALNYFSQVDETQSLFLNVERRLLASVPSDHGKVFESILAQFNLSPRRIVIMFPRAIASDPSLLERVARNYRSRGYRVLVPASSWDDSTLRLLEELPVDLVKVDVVQGFRAERLAAFGAALRERGISLLASRVESAEMLTQVRETEVNLVQGFILGGPAPLPTVRRCQRSFLTHHTAHQAALSGMYAPRVRAAGMPTGT